MKPDRYIMAIDPSINTMGVAVYHKHRKALCYWDLHKPKNRKANEFEKSLSLYHQLLELRGQYKIVNTIVEVPVHWERDGFVAREAGSIQKMMLVIGMIYTFGDVMTVPPHGWKGQMPKKVCHRRLNKRYPKEVPMSLDNNVVDAIGIGHWYLFGRV